MTRTEFIKIINPIVLELSKEHKIIPSLVIAQGLLESEGGTSELAINACNLFGIKGSYNGNSYKKDTKEWNGKEFITVKADFKKYPSWAECIKDAFERYTTMPRYKNLIGDFNYKSVCVKVHEDGYATDPGYAEKLISTIEDYKLYELDNEGSNDMNIDEKYLTPNPYSRPQKKIKDIKGIVVHWVANPNSQAINNRNYFESLKDKKIFASAHYIIGLKGEIIQCLPLNEIGYHVGAKSYRTNKLGEYPNAYTIGIECCHLDWNGKMTDETYKSLIELVKMLCDKYKLNPTIDLYRHYDVTGKLCHRYFVDNAGAWDKLKDSIYPPVQAPRVFIEGKEVKSINVDNENYIRVAELRNMGYKVIWDAEKRIVEVDV